MKNNYFSIGDLSKLYNIPIRTLRYYDEIGLLKPAKVDELSNYRYYTVEQFILVDLIKNSKLMGMSLAEIKKLVTSELTIDRLEHVVGTQIEQYQEQINQLVTIQNSMISYLNIIQQTRKLPQGKIFVNYESERYCYSFQYHSADVVETEEHLRKAFLDAGSVQNDVYPIFGAAGNWQKYMRDGSIEYLDIRQYLDAPQDIENVTVIPKGQYISIVFDEPASNKGKYYQIMKDYITDNHIKISGNCNETWLVPRLNLNQQESTLMRLDILIENID